MSEDTEKKPKERQLNPKQELFCQQYTIHWNATRAAKEAGYSEKSAMELGYQLLQNPSVKSRIEKLTEHALKEMGISRARVLNELSRIAFTNMSDLANWNESGVRFKSSEEISPEIATAISEVSETVTQAGGTLKIKQHDKVKALELLGKHLKMFTDKHEHSGPDGKPIETLNKSDLTDEQIDERLALLMAKINSKTND